MNAATVRELIDYRASVSSDAVYLLLPGTESRFDSDLSFAQMKDRVSAVAQYLTNQGLKTGDSVGFAMSNGPECALCVLGILYGGFRLTAINLAAGKQTIGYVLSHSDAKLVLTQSQHLTLLSDALKDATPQSTVRLVDTDSAWWDGLPTECSPTTEITSHNDGLLMYTSGTTGRPKGVVLTQGSLVAAGRNPTTAHALTPNDRALCVLPLYHINGLCTTLLAPLYSGGSVMIPERFSRSKFWQWIRDHQCTWFSVVPTHVSYLLYEAADKDNPSDGLSHVRFGRSASAPLSPEVHHTFEDTYKIPIVETMGLTETCGQILSNPLPPGTRKIGSPGIAVGCEVIIADKGQQEVPCGTEGEILIRGDCVMNRYLKNHEATDDTLTTEGWLRTGDLGTIDEDGYVFVTGRIKELIIKGGENIAPREVDEALYHHPDVLEAAAFACPCENYGQRVEAAVATQPDSAVDEAALLAICVDLLGKFKSPDRIHFLPELPKGPSGKIQRRKLSELLEGNRSF